MLSWKCSLCCLSGVQPLWLEVENVWPCWLGYHERKSNWSNFYNRMIGLQSIYHVEINLIRCIVITRKKCGIKETDTWAPQDVLLRERKNPLQVVDSIAELIVHEKKSKSSIKAYFGSSWDWVAWWLGRGYFRWAFLLLLSPPVVCAGCFRLLWVALRVVSGMRLAGGLGRLGRVSFVTMHCTFYPFNHFWEGVTLCNLTVQSTLSSRVIEAQHHDMEVEELRTNFLSGKAQ